MVNNQKVALQYLSEERNKHPTTTRIPLEENPTKDPSWEGVPMKESKPSHKPTLKHLKFLLKKKKIRYLIGLLLGMLLLAVVGEAFPVVKSMLDAFILVSMEEVANG